MKFHFYLWNFRITKRLSTGFGLRKLLQAKTSAPPVSCTTTKCSLKIYFRPIKIFEWNLKITSLGSVRNFANCPSLILTQNKKDGFDSQSSLSFLVKMNENNKNVRHRTCVADGQGFLTDVTWLALLHHFNQCGINSWRTFRSYAVYLNNVPDEISQVETIWSRVNPLSFWNIGIYNIIFILQATNFRKTN